MTNLELEKSLRHHFGDVVGNNSGVITVNGEPPTADMLASAPQWLASSLEAERINAIKLKANEIITAKYPAWKQVNLAAQSIEMMLFKGFMELPDDVFPPAKKQALMDSILGIGAWSWVKQVRAESDRLEGDASAIPDWPQ